MTAAGREAFFADDYAGRMSRYAAQQIVITLNSACDDLPDSFKDAHGDVRWRQLAGMRHRLAHQYQGINNEVIWASISQAIPDMLARLGLD